MEQVEIENNSDLSSKCQLLDGLLSHFKLKRELIFVGGGKMAAALCQGFVASGLFTENNIAVSVKTIASKQRWNDRGYKYVYTSNLKMVSNHWNGIVFIAVKPQVRHLVIEELDLCDFTAPFIVSIMGGVNLETLKKEFPRCECIIRLMPNIPTAVKAGASVICSSLLVSKELDLVTFLMQHIGECIQIKEDEFDAATAIVGCSPAYMFCAIEALSDGGVLCGLNRSTAIKLAANAMMGAAKMVLDQDKHPALLKDDVCSAGGCTVYGLRELEKNGFRSSLIEAVYAASQRSSQYQNPKDSNVDRVEK